VGDVIVKGLSLAAIVLLGYGLKRLGWVRAEHFSVLSIIVLRVTLPAALISSFNTVDITATMVWLIVIGLAVNLIRQGFTWLTTRHRSPAERSFAILHSGSYNVGAFAMPYTAQLAGPTAMVYTAMFDIGNSITAGGIGYGWGMMTARGQRVRIGRFLLTMLHSPVFIVYVALMTLRLAHLSLPDQVITFTSLVGQANPFCAMLMIGVGLELNLPRAVWAAAGRALLERYLFVIAFCLVIWFLIPSSVLSVDAKTILVVVLWAPIAVMVAGFVDEAHGDVRLASLMSSISVIIAVVMMPAMFLVLR
jgi:predicted permease